MPTLQNDQLSVTIHHQGAELASVIDQRDQTQYVWQADPAHWGRHAPVLFPIVGRLREDQYQHRGQPYRLTQHGFARDCAFELTETDPDFLQFVLQADVETLAVYPFDFALGIRYTLADRSLTVAYTVENRGEAVMPFGLGAHPAFTCPLVPGELMTDYDLVFSHPETAARHLLAGGLYTGETEPVLTDADRIPVTPTLFDQDALVFHELASEWVALRSRVSGREVRVSLAGFPYLGLWSKPGAPFVCLEPWQGLADYTDASGDMTDKPGMHLLMPEQVHQAAYVLTFG
jgi:galactose mutarotase-like enzyme